jgi:hypothetical protein
MARATLNVYSQPSAPDQDSEYNRWYDEVHIPQVLKEIPEIKSAKRYRLSSVQIVSPEERPTRRYLTVYEVETDDLTALRDRLVEALDDGSLDWSEAIDLVELSPIPHFYEPAH